MANIMVAVSLIGGVLAGSAPWWLLPGAGVARLRQRPDARLRQRIHLASALLLAGFALWQGVSLLGS